MKTRPPHCPQPARPSRRWQARAGRPRMPNDVRNRYLDTVPDDSLRIVLQYLSRRPQHRNWHAYISARSVNVVLDVGGALARAALSEFRSIGGKDGIRIDADADASILRPLVSRLPLRRLVLQLPAVKVLPDLLHRCGAQLREMVLYGTVFTRTDVLAVSNHCPRLSSLAIHGNRIEGTLAPIWRSLAASLTQIHMCRRILGAIAAPCLAQHCLNLRRVDVLVLNDVAVDALVALGGRIRVLGIAYQYGFDITPWQDVYNACVNLEAVHLALENNSEESIDVLSLMCPKLVSLTLHSVLLTAGERLFSVLSACSALETVQFNVLLFDGEELFCKFFESIKSVTTLTCVTLEPVVDLNRTIVDLVARNLISLKSLTLSIGTHLEGSIVNALVDLHCLKYVTLRTPSFKQWVLKPAEQCAVEVVNSLKDCTQLAQLEIDDVDIKNRSQLIAEAAAMYGRKDFDMFIGGVQYRTW